MYKVLFLTGIKWTFIVELAPWIGRFYERLVGIVKCVLQKLIDRKSLTDVPLHTILKEAESVFNLRPLVYVGENLDASITLTPSHFLFKSQGRNTTNRDG